MGTIVYIIFLCTVRSPEGKLSLYCKGADTIIYERLHESCRKLMDVTTDHLNVSSIFLCVRVCVQQEKNKQNSRSVI